MKNVYEFITIHTPIKYYIFALKMLIWEIGWQFFYHLLFLQGTQCCGYLFFVEFILIAGTHKRASNWYFFSIFSLPSSLSPSFVSFLPFFFLFCLSSSFPFFSPKRQILQRKKQREKKRGSSICWCIPQMPATAGDELIWSWEQAAFLCSLTRTQGPRPKAILLCFPSP